jgi:uncharacterized caspase-like protein
VTDRALLVGINAYPAPNELRGCINDIEDMAAFIVDAYGFHKPGIRLLKDAHATTHGIRTALAHLVHEAKPGDRLLFHYSGHGAQMPSHNEHQEVDGLDEVICPVDFDWSDEHALRDKDFHSIFASVPKGVEFVWVSDSCHSGDLFRDLRPPNAPYRKPRFIAPPQAIANEIAVARANGIKRAPLLAPTAAPNVALIAGCKSTQTSADADFGQRANGAATYFLLQQLKRKPTARLSTIIPKVVAALEADQFEQEPQLEGDPGLEARSFLQA